MKRKAILVAALFATTVLVGCENAASTKETGDDINANVAVNSGSSEVAPAEEEQTKRAQDSPYGQPIESLSEFFNNGADSGYSVALHTEADSLSIIYNSTRNLYAWYDAEGNVYYEGPYGKVSDFIGGRCVLDAVNKSSGQQCYILTEADSGLTITTPPGITEDDGNNIICYEKDSTGYTLWTARKEDKVTGSALILTAWDNEGNIKLQASTEDVLNSGFNVNESYAALLAGERNQDYLNSALFYRSGPYYVFKVYNSANNNQIHYVLNVETGTVSACVGDRESSLYIYDDVALLVKKGANTYSIDVMNLDFSTRFPCAVWDYSPYSNGLLYLKGPEVSAGYYDASGNLVIDLSAYSVTKGYAFNDEGTAVVSMFSPDNIPFTGLMKADGTWVMEPQKGSTTTVQNGYFVFGGCAYDYSGNMQNQTWGMEKIVGASFSPLGTNGERLGVVQASQNDKTTNCVVVIMPEGECKKLCEFQSY